MSVREYHILDELYVRDPSLGGRIVAIYGPPGTGKTTLAVKLAKEWLKGDYVLWRGLRISQALLYFPHVVLWIPEGAGLELYNMDEKREMILEELDPPAELRRFVALEDLIQGLVYGYVNVVYMPKWWWLELLARLPDLWPGHEFLSVFVDEMDDLTPPWPKGKLWTAIEAVVQGMEDYRKALINFVMIAQQPRRLYYGIRDMTMYRIYMPGASKEKDDRFRQGLLDNLSLGTGIIARGQWEPIEFSEVKVVRPRMRVRLTGIMEAEAPGLGMAPSLPVSISLGGTIDAEEVLRRYGDAGP